MVSAIDDEDNEVYLSKALMDKFDNQDPFHLQLRDVRKLRGLSRNFIRKADRQAQKGFYGKDGAKSKQITDEMFYGYGYLDCVSPPYNMDYLAKLYDISPANHAAVDAKVESVFGLGWDWIESPSAKHKREATRTQDGLSRLESHIENARNTMTEWLDDINNLDVWDKVMKKIGVDYETTGNAYMEIGRTASGKIGYIGHVPSANVRIRRERDGFVQLIGRDIVFFRNFGTKVSNTVTDDSNPNEMIHFTKYSPSSLYYGIPDILASKGALAGNEFANRYNLDYFENKTVPRHVIVVKGGSLSAASIEKLVEFFETGLRGQHHRSIYIPLNKQGENGPDPEIEFKSVEADKQDFSFGEYREANNEEIFMSHRLPMSRAGVFGKNVSLAAAREADKVFKESYSRPEQRIFEKQMARIFREETEIVIFKLNELSLVDADTQSKIDERDVRMQILLPNEVRRTRGQPARPDGDGNKPWQASAQQKAEQTSQASNGRQRDQQRQSNSTDSSSSTNTRNAKGEGRQTA